MILLLMMMTELSTQQKTEAGEETGAFVADNHRMTNRGNAMGAVAVDKEQVLQ